MKVTAARLEATIRIAAIRREQIAGHMAAIRQDAITRDSATSAARFRELQAGRGIAPYKPRSKGEHRATQAARYAKKQGCTLLKAAAVFKVARDAVERAWARLFPNEQRGVAT